MHFSTFISAFPSSLILMLAMICVPHFIASKKAIDKRDLHTSRWQGILAISSWMFCWGFACVIASQIWHLQKEWLQIAAFLQAHGSVPYFEAGGFTHAQALHYHLLSVQSLEQSQALNYQMLAGNVWYAIFMLIAPMIVFGDRYLKNRLRGRPSVPTVSPA